MPAIASLEDLKSAQKDLQEAKDLNKSKVALMEVTQSSSLITDERWRRIGWKNICKLWLEERNPEQLKGEGDH